MKNVSVFSNPGKVFAIFHENYIKMPQVRKSSEQILLENRINKTRRLMSHMLSQLRSLRARNKAQRERERRQKKVETQSTAVENSFRC